MNPETGVKVRFDKAVSGKQGFEGKDHYHILNPNKAGEISILTSMEMFAIPVHANRIFYRKEENDNETD